MKKAKRIAITVALCVVAIVLLLLALELTAEIYFNNGIKYEKQRVRDSVLNSFDKQRPERIVKPDQSIGFVRNSNGTFEAVGRDTDVPSRIN